MSVVVIVADASKARIFKTTRGFKTLTEFEDFIHSESRLTNKELMSDTSRIAANLRGSLQPRTFPKDHEEQTFAKQLGKHLKELHSKEPYEELVLVASPRFLGMLRNELHASIADLVSHTINKELILLDKDELLKYLRNK
jgi:protein required for attachment to host cells